MAFRIIKRQIGATIPTASMADIAFLLIIFFMVTTVFQLDKTNVDLPKTAERFEVGKDFAYIVLTRDGMVKFTSGEEASFEISGVDELYYHVATITSVNSAHPFVVKADRDVKYYVIDRVLEIMREAQAKNIFFLSTQKTVEDMRRE